MFEKFALLLQSMRRSGISQYIVLLFALLVGFSFIASPAASERRAILFLGDSLTAGYGLDPAQAYPALIQEKIDARGWKFRVINAGQSGDTSAGGLNRLDWLLRTEIDVLVLELGANDGLRGLPVEVTRKNLQAIIDRTQKKYPGVKIIVAGMQVPPNMGAAYSDQFRRIFTELAERNRVNLIPFLLDGVGGVPELNLPDGIHPNLKGHERVAEIVWKTLEPVLRAKSGALEMRGKS